MSSIDFNINFVQFVSYHRMRYIVSICILHSLSLNLNLRLQFAYYLCFFKMICFSFRIEYTRFGFISFVKKNQNATRTHIHTIRNLQFVEFSFHSFAVRFALHMLTKNRLYLFVFYSYDFFFFLL